VIDWYVRCQLLGACRELSRGLRKSSMDHVGGTVKTPLAITAVEALFEKTPGPSVGPLLSDEVVLKPPTYWKVWRGKNLVSRLLPLAAGNIDKLRYVRRFQMENCYALQFEAKIAGLTFSGVDIVTLNDDGRICEIEIVARPPNAMLELSKRMAVAIAADPFFAEQSRVSDGA